MRIALVNIFKPREGSGDGITEYTYQLYKRLRKKHRVDLFYALEESRRIDISGRLYVETFFRSTLGKLIAGDYDIVHITNGEIGYFAKGLRKAGVRAKIVVTIHDFIRVAYLHGTGGAMQSAYDRLVTGHVGDAVRHADYIIFPSSREQMYAETNYQLPEHSLIPYGSRDAFLHKPIPRKTRGSGFTIGYIGGLIKSRNVDFILRTAELLDSSCTFRIYGVGGELQRLLQYKHERAIKNVEFMGFAPEKGILGIYDSLDLFMSCSSVDVASLPIEDALARGLPVVVAEKNLYDDELKKRVYQAGTPSDAARIIKKLKGHGYPKSMQGANLRYARTNSWDNAARKTELVYRRLTK